MRLLISVGAETYTEGEFLNPFIAIAYYGLIDEDAKDRAERCVKTLKILIQSEKSTHLQEAFLHVRDTRGPCSYSWR